MQSLLPPALVVCGGGGAGLGATTGRACLDDALFTRQQHARHSDRLAYCACHFSNVLKTEKNGHKN